MLDKIDKVLGDALERISIAAHEIRECDELDSDSNLRLIGETTIKLWDIREKIYGIRPDLKPDFVVEIVENKDSYDKQSSLYTLAEEKEEEGNLQAAKELYTQLLKLSTIRHFERIAQAGLYRVDKKS